MHYASMDDIVAEIADDMDLTSTRAVEVLDHVVETDSLEFLPIAPDDVIDWTDADDVEWDDDVDFE